MRPSGVFAPTSPMLIDARSTHVSRSQRHRYVRAPRPLDTKPKIRARRTFSIKAYTSNCYRSHVFCSLFLKNFFSLSLCEIIFTPCSPFLFFRQHTYAYNRDYPFEILLAVHGKSHFFSIVMFLVETETRLVLRAGPDRGVDDGPHHAQDPRPVRHREGEGPDQAAGEVDPGSAGSAGAGRRRKL